MELYGSFEERGYKIEAYMPSSDAEPQQFTLKVYKDGNLSKEATLEMLFPPIFGVDVEDVQRLEEKTEEFIKLLP